MKKIESTQGRNRRLACLWGNGSVWWVTASSSKKIIVDSLKTNNIVNKKNLKLI